MLMLAAETRVQMHARLLRGWMADRGLKAPSLALSVEKQGQQISPDYIRKLVRGERELAGMPLELREAVRRALRVPAQDWEEATGLATAVDINPDDTPLLASPIPKALAEAAKEYGGEFAHPMWQRHLAELYFRGEPPKTPKAWYFLYLSLSEFGLGPRGDG